MEVVRALAADHVPATAGLVRDFLNTVEHRAGRDLLASGDEVREWLARRRLVEAPARITRVDLLRLDTVRESLREVLLAHSGAAVDAARVQILNDTLAAVPLRAEFDVTGRQRIVGVLPDGATGAIARLLGAVQSAVADGSWTRLKICAEPACRRAFYDASRNRSGRWCSMAGCGNQAKMRRAYSARKQRAQGA